MLTVAHGGQWDKTMEEFIRWSLQYDLWCKIHFFHEGIQSAENEVWKTNQRGPQNLLDSLPDTFSVEDAANARLRAGMNPADTRKMLKVWKYRKHVEQISETTYRKTASKRL